MRTAFLWTLVVASIGISVGGIFLAVDLGDDSHGGRGGAIGVALSFGFLFATSFNTYRSIETFDEAASSLSELLGTEKNTEEQASQNTKRLNMLHFDIQTDVSRQQIQNRLLAFTGVFSTFIWGFGDLIAKHFIA